MTGLFVYRSGPAGIGWKWDADARTRKCLRPLSNSWLLSENYSANRTTIGHIAHGHDYVVFVHHDRSFAGQLIPKPQYSEAGFDPFEIVITLPQATEALRDAVAWGDALHKSLTIGKAVGIVSNPDLNAAFQATAKETEDDAVDGESTTVSNPSSPWLAPANTHAVAISRALFLAEPPARRVDNYFSVLPPGLKNAAAPLCRLVDTGGARLPAAILDAALALPEARAEERPVALALSGPNMQASISRNERAPSPGSAPVSVRQLAPPSTNAPDTRNPNTPEQEPTDRPPDTPSRETDDELLPPTAVPPNSQAGTGARELPWWLSPAATAAVALLLAVWISSQIADLNDLRDEVAAAREEAEAARVQAETEREQAETAREQAETAREEAETAREEAEAARVQAETEREQAETEREQAETEREQAETARGQAETAREEAEAARVQAETEREQAETAREEAETAREEAETAREEAEAARVQAETEREQAETAREQAETAREEAETAREEAVTLPTPSRNFGLPSNTPLSFGNRLNGSLESDNE